MEKNCNEVVQKKGIFFLKYTFVKFDGLCREYNKDGKILKEESFSDGKKQGRFLIFNDKSLTDYFYMKNNKIDGEYKKFKNKKLYKKIYYINGNIQRCLIDLDYIMLSEKKLSTLKKKYSENSEKKDILKTIREKEIKLLSNKQDCEIIKFQQL